MFVIHNNGMEAAIRKLQLKPESTDAATEYADLSLYQVESPKRIVNNQPTDFTGVHPKNSIDSGLVLHQSILSP